MDNSENRIQIVNESYQNVKRKYADKPALGVHNKGVPIRTRVFRYLNQYGEVNREQLQNLFHRIANERGLSHVPSVGFFLRRNRGFIDCVKRKGGIKKYRLSTYGKRVLKMLNQKTEFETTWDRKYKSTSKK